MKQKDRESKLRELRKSLLSIIKAPLSAKLESNKRAHEDIELLRTYQMTTPKESDIINLNQQAIQSYELRNIQFDGNIQNTYTTLPPKYRKDIPKTFFN